MSELSKALLTIFSAIITVAIVSVIVSRKSDSAGLVQSLGTSFSNVIKSAVTPVTAPAALPKGTAIANLGGVNSLVNVDALMHGDIDMNLPPLF